MKFSMETITAILFCASTVSGFALAEPMAQDQSVPPNNDIPSSTTTGLTGQKDASGALTMVQAPEADTDQALQKRAGPIVAVIGIAGAAAATIITKIAIEIGADFIKDIGKWNKAREEFTKKTTAEMWSRNPDYKRYPAAVCYNKGYKLQNNAKITGKLSAKFSLGLLKTDYDCMFLEAPNTFMTLSEGGYINLSYTYNNRCKFNSGNGDLTCT